MPSVDPKSPLTILGGSDVALLIVMLLPWQGVDLGVGSSVLGVNLNASAWRAFSYTDLLLFLAGASAIATFVLTGQGHPQAENALKAAAGLGGFCTLLVLYRIVNQPGPNEIVNVKIGAFLGLISVAGIAFGAFRTMTSGPDA